MINSLELITKFSRLIGIPETEARLSFEILALQIAQKLSFGDQIEIESIGYFSFKKVKLNASSDDQHQRLIIFSTDRISQSNKDILLFFLPAYSKKDFPQIDSYLNLSFGKPLIPLDRISENEFILPSSSNEMISLIESKVEKLISESAIFQNSETINQEFFLQSEEEKILLEVPKVDEPSISIEETKSEEESESPAAGKEKVPIKIFDDFELVGSDTAYLEDLTGTDQADKWIFNDLALKKEIEDQDENVENKEGYTEVRDKSLKLMMSKNKSIEENVRNREAEIPVQKPRMSLLRRLVFTVLTIIILTSAAVGVYLNYDQIKKLISQYIGDKPKVTEVKKIVAPKIILRTSEIPASFSYDKSEPVMSAVNDSMIINPTVFNLGQDLIESGTSKNEISINGSKESGGTLLKVGDNIYKKNSEYIVQVSSWKSKLKAETEMKKLVDKGYNASLMEYTSASIGKYYRVRVGGFKSLHEVNNFLNKNN